MGKDTSDWNDQDAAALTKYILDHPRFLEELATRMPTIKTGNAEEAAMSGSRYAGAQDLLKAVKDMQGSQGGVRATPFIDPSQD